MVAFAFRGEEEIEIPAEKISGLESANGAEIAL